MNLNIFAALHTRLSHARSARQSERYKCDPLADTDTFTDTFADAKCIMTALSGFSKAPKCYRANQEALIAAVFAEDTR